MVSLENDKRADGSVDIVSVFVQPTLVSNMAKNNIPSLVEVFKIIIKIKDKDYLYNTIKKQSYCLLRIKNIFFRVAQNVFFNNKVN